VVKQFYRIEILNHDAVHRYRLTYALIRMMLYLLARTLPRLEESQTDRKGFLERWFASDIPEKVDLVLNQFLVKFLRKLKVLLLRVDNSLSTHLKKIKPNRLR